MSDSLTRFTAEPSEFEALLLRAADDDEPARGTLEHVAASLGVSTGALAASAASAHGVATGAVTHKLTFASLAKWLAVGVGAGTLASGSAHWVAERGHANTAEPQRIMATERPERAAPVRGVRDVAKPAAPFVASAAPSPVLPPNTAPARAVVATQPDDVSSAATTVGELPSSASFSPLEDARGRGTAVAIDAASSLGAETQALDAVRAHLAAGHATAALDELARYRARFPHAALAAEASLLRIEALLRSGRRAEAEHAAAELGARAPDSRYASRARSLLANARGGAGHD